MKELKIVLILVFVLGMISSCKKDEESNPNGFVDGMVTDGVSSQPLEGVSIIAFDSNTKQPVKSTTSDAEGKFRFELLPTSYYLILTKQNYQDNPPKAISPIPFTIAQGATETVLYEMSPLNNSTSGWVEGIAKEGSNNVAGALVVVESADKAFSTFSDQEGKFKIYNIDAGTYQINAWLSGYNAEFVSIEVGTNTTTDGIEIAMTKNASGVFSGQVRNIASENKDVDVSLVHKITGESIPGLTTFSVSQNFRIENVPNGTFIARATYENDDRIMDPDRIAKFGEPVIVINNDTKELTFDITNSVGLTSPTNAAAKIIPVEISSTTPTFEWKAYSSSSDYVIEVTDVNGNVVWGGFTYVSDLPEKNIVIPSSQLSIVFNSDGNATIAELVPGQIYRWKVYASKDDKNSTTGWTLISASEDQRGLFKIVE